MRNKIKQIHFEIKLISWHHSYIDGTKCDLIGLSILEFRFSDNKNYPLFYFCQTPIGVKVIQFLFVLPAFTW